MATGGEISGVDTLEAGAVHGSIDGQQPDISSVFADNQQQSDAVQEYTCSPCSQNDLTIEATHYCPECGVCYCKACLCDHVVIGRSKVEQWGKMDHVCLRHPGYAVSLYCVYHDVLCCKMCSSKDHRSCGNMELLSVAAMRSGIDKKVKNVKSEMERLDRNAETLAKESKMRKKLTHMSHSNYANQLDELKQHIIAVIDGVNKFLLDRKHHYMEKYDMDIDISKSITDELNEIKKNMDLTDDKEQHFICVMQAKEWIRDKLNEIKEMLNATVYGMFERLTLKEEDKILDEVFGSITSRLRMTDMRFSLGANGDEETCEIVGICQIDNGNIVVADKGNTCLKQLDNSYKVTSQFKLDDKPSGLCVAGDSRVAVAMVNNKVMLLSVGKTLEEVRTIDIAISCRGIGQIAYRNGNVYIFDSIKCTCNYMYYSCCKCETTVNVYEDESGVSVRNMIVKVSRPHIKDSESDRMLIAVNFDGDKVFVVYPTGFLISFDKLGNAIHCQSFYYEEYRFIGLWIDNLGLVNLFGNHSLSGDLRIIKFSQDKLKEVETVTVSSFLKQVEPMAVCYDRNLGRVVACPEKGDHIYVEKFTYSD